MLVLRNKASYRVELILCGGVLYCNIVLLCLYCALKHCIVLFGIIKYMLRCRYRGYGGDHWPRRMDCISDQHGIAGVVYDGALFCGFCAFDTGLIILVA